MKILVTFAVEAEFAPWRRRHSFDPVDMPTPVGLQSRNLYRGVVFGNNVDVLLTGIGWEATKTANSPRYVLRELLKLQPDVCVSSGLAGGLASDLKAGEVVAARALSLRAGGDVIHCNSNLVSVAEEAGARVKRMQVTETHIVSEASAKASLAPLADFVDMEGYYILQIVDGTVPAISVRAISDTQEDNLPSGIEKIVDREGHVQTLPLLKLLLRKPSQIPSLVDFGAKSKGAAVSLADFLDRFLEVLDDDTSEAQAKRERVAAR
jgi:nucleoside phosphorylase